MEKKSELPSFSNMSITIHSPSVSPAGLSSSISLSASGARLVSSVGELGIEELGDGLDFDLSLEELAERDAHFVQTTRSPAGAEADIVVLTN